MDDSPSVPLRERGVENVSSTRTLEERRAYHYGWIGFGEECLSGSRRRCGGSNCAQPAALTQLGHTVKLMAPQFVKPYVKTNKNDMRDAEAQRTKT